MIELAERHTGSYFATLKEMSRQFASIELIPCHSFGDPGLQLPSMDAIRSFVQKAIIPTAVAGEKTVIIAKRRNAWGHLSTSENIVVYNRGQARGANLGPETPGGEAIR